MNPLLPDILAASALSKWAVAICGGAIIALINWYFFFARKSERSAVARTGTQEASVVVRGGYEPQLVRVKAGVPVRLTFDRQETGSCSEEVVFPDFGVRRFLPAYEKTAIEITPEKPGTYEFTCGMNMLRGRVIAE